MRVGDRALLDSGKKRRRTGEVGNDLRLFRKAYSEEVDDALAFRGQRWTTNWGKFGGWTGKISGTWSNISGKSECAQINVDNSQ